MIMENVNVSNIGCLDGNNSLNVNESKIKDQEENDNTVYV